MIDLSDPLSDHLAQILEVLAVYAASNPLATNDDLIAVSAGGGEFAAGFLANELAKACSGLQCSLPRRVQSIARQGVTIQIVDNPDFLRDGLVGLTEVDQFIVSVNPHGLHSSSRSYNPDTLRNRAKQPTWPAP